VVSAFFVVVDPPSLRLHAEVRATELKKEVSIELERYAVALEESGGYRVLRRLPDPEVQSPSEAEGIRTAIALDTETTGLNPDLDEVIELGMVAFTYGLSGQILEVIGTFNGLNEPSAPISEEITAITGITNSMVAGQKLEIAQVESFVDKAAIVVAHNASFDRPFCEQLSPIFRQKAWACSATEVPWRALGYEGVKLSYLLYQSGYFHDGHRALDDSIALLKVLSDGGKTKSPSEPFRLLLESARRSRFRIRIPAPFEARATLRQRGYRWFPGDLNVQGHWEVEVDEIQLQQELGFISQFQHTRRAAPEVTKLTAFDRFRSS
jgi:DNA polymerase-3 subunit epsilon